MKTVYIGNALTNVPQEFLDNIDILRQSLRQKGWRVLEYLGTVDGSCRDVWKRDMHDCVGACNILLGIADYSSTGLGIEIGLMIGRHKGPVLIVANESRVRLTNPRQVTRAIQDPDEKFVRFTMYKDFSEIPSLLDQFCLDIQKEGHSFGPTAPPLEQFPDAKTGQPLFRQKKIAEKP